MSSSPFTAVVQLLEELERQRRSQTSFAIATALVARFFAAHSCADHHGVLRILLPDVRPLSYSRMCWCRVSLLAVSSRSFWC